MGVEWRRAVQTAAMLVLVACNGAAPTAAPTLAPERTRRPPRPTPTQETNLNGAPDITRLGPVRASWELSASDLLALMGNKIHHRGITVEVVADPAGLHGLVVSSTVEDVRGQMLGLSGAGATLDAPITMSDSCWMPPILSVVDMYFPRLAGVGRLAVVSVGGFFVGRGGEVADTSLTRMRDGSVVYQAYAQDRGAWRAGEELSRVAITEGTWRQFATLITADGVYTYVDGTPTSRVVTAVEPVCDIVAGPRVFLGSDYDGFMMLSANNLITVHGKPVTR